MSADQAGVFVYKGSSGSNDVIVMNNKVGIRAPEHTIEGANIVSEWNVATNHDVDVGGITKTPQLRTTHIKLYSDGHTQLKIDAPIHIRDGGLNVNNLDLKTLPDGTQINLTKGDIVCRNVWCTGKLEAASLFEHTMGHDSGKHIHSKSVRAEDGSIYVGLMRRSYDRATHKPVTHILKRQIPAYLVAQGFTLVDIPSPFTVENMTIHNWVVLAQNYKDDTSIEVDTVFPAATTADWESFIDPISIDLDAAELEIDDHETRIVLLESAGGGGNDLSPVTVYEVDPTMSTHVNIAAGVLGLVLIAHYNISGVTVSLPSMSVGDIINVNVGS